MSVELPRYVYDAGAGDVIIDFAECLAEDPHQTLETMRKDVFGGTGIKQTNFFYTNQVITLVHEFVPEATIDLVDTMMTSWVLKGNTFDFYEDQTVTGSYLTLELLDKKFKPKRMNKKVDIWKYKIKCRVQI